MNEPFDSIYPDFLRTGLGKLNDLGAHREILHLFAALEHLRSDLHTQEDPAAILQVSHHYIAGLNLFQTAGFYLVNPKDFDFELALCVPGAEAAWLEQFVRKEISAGRFAWALRQTSPVFFQGDGPDAPRRGLFHALAVPNQVVGMFCGVLGDGLTAVREVPLSLLSMLLGASTDALVTARKTAQLTSQIKTLSGLLPICAWCKKVRDDQGYWGQIEQYVRDHSAASFSHGICPDCLSKHFPHASAETQP